MNRRKNRPDMKRSFLDLEIPWRTVIILSVLAALALTSCGCATIERHPKLVAAGVIVLSTSLVLSTRHGSTVEPEFKMSEPSTCAPSLGCKP